MRLMGLALATAATVVSPVVAYASSTLLPWRGLFDLGARDAAWWRVAHDEVALTFDDGPEPECSLRLLDTLNDAGVKATFFFLGGRARLRPDIVRRVAEAGHALGNHTFFHETLVWRSDAFITSTLQRTQSAIFDACGVCPRLVRPPFGRRDGTFYAVAQRLQLAPVFWSRDSFDWLRRNRAALAARLGNARGGDIVLLHDRAAGASASAASALREGMALLAERKLRMVSSWCRS